MAFCIAANTLLFTNCDKITGVLPPELLLPLPPELLLLFELELTVPLPPELLLLFELELTAPLPPELLLLFELELTLLPEPLLPPPVPHFDAGFSAGKHTLPTHLKFFIAKEPSIADIPDVTVPFEALTSPTSSQAKA
jgi:hypothetical protein